MTGSGDLHQPWGQGEVALGHKTLPAARLKCWACEAVRTDPGLHGGHTAGRQGAWVLVIPDPPWAPALPPGTWSPSAHGSSPQDIPSQAQPHHSGAFLATHRTL